MLSEAYGSRCIRCRYQTTSMGRRTMILSHSFFLAAPRTSDISGLSFVLLLGVRRQREMTTSYECSNEVELVAALCGSG